MGRRSITSRGRDSRRRAAVSPGATVASMVRVACCAAAVLVVAGCGGADTDPRAAARLPVAAPPAVARSRQDDDARPRPRAEASPFLVTAGGELTTPGEISFRIRPLSGPGSMGPSELAPESDVALSHVQKYLDAHPDERLRIECAINVFRTSSGPNSPYAAHLANLVARRLVALGIACGRVEPVARLVREPDAPVHAVRFLVRWSSEPPDAREDPCSPPPD
jgi:hypothetical protein